MGNNNNFRILGFTSKLEMKSPNVKSMIELQDDSRAIPVSTTRNLSSLIGGPEIFATNSSWTIIIVLICLYLMISGLGLHVELIGHHTFGRAFGQLAFYTVPTVGGLLNATFGNATELIISLFAMKQGMLRLVQQSLLGSILSNMLLVLGCALFSGGITHYNKEQMFNKSNAGMNVGLLLMAVMALIFPTVLHVTHTELHIGTSVLALSRFCSCDTPTASSDSEEFADISKWESIIWLGVLTLFISVLSEYLVNAIEGASVAMDVPVAFISVILLPIVGNAAEHASAIMFAVKDKLDISLGVAIGSSTQISMFVVGGVMPICVVVGWIIGRPMDLDFEPFETATLFMTVLVVAFMLQFSKMMFSRGAKRSIEILSRRVSTPIHSKYGYVTRSYGENFISEPKRNETQCTTVRTYSSEVSPSDHMNLIKKLRERTSAPIKEVKSALIDCNWDLEEAQKELRKRGVVLASKKSSRTAAEGLLALSQNDKKAVVIELNCETDFVARNEIFQYLASSLAKLALSAESSEQVPGSFPIGLQSLENLKINFDHPKLSGETTVQNAITEVAAMMGENVKLRRGFAMPISTHGVISTYLHTCPHPGLGRIAGILSLEVDDENAPLDAVQRVGSELAMHVVAAKPLFLTKEHVSSDAVQNEREILKSQAESSGRPQAAIEKMVEGRLRKYFEEVVLMEQKFIVNNTINVKTLLSELSKEVGSPVKIGNFLRMEVGEGFQRADAPEDLAQAA
ncbi:hypothetical protein L1987_55497 [Smallanthus sonchifolius]|uniref:Uncharacterized protein n=1 Tax=Smallanthus sonchifolius TaxID=185202 RepID=A0ACB9EAE7_9ASTR|nr:hypothetical protein L1987_55497 [Smallanthus sonchifolius]